MKIRITENQYTKLVKEQRISIDKIKKNLPDPLKKIAEAIIKRLTNPTSLDYKAIRNLSKEKLKKVLSYIPSKYKNNNDAPTLYPIPTLEKKLIVVMDIGLLLVVIECTVVLTWIQLI